MNLKYLPLALMLALAGTASAQYNPVPLTPGSFTQDIIIEKGAPPPLENFVNCTLDSGTNAIQNTFFEQGFVQGMPFTGLPPHGTTFVSRLDGNHTFKMPPSYVTNNAAYVGAANIPGTTPAILVTQVVNAAFTVLSPAQSYQSLSVLWASGGAGLVDVTVSHQDGTKESFQITTIDWFNNSSSYAYIAQGRVSLDSGGGSLNNMRSTTVTKLFNTDIYLGNSTSPVTSVAFAYNATSGANYRFFGFALSGSTDNITYTPIDVAGFNADAVVEADAQFRSYYVRGYNVTMDGGANANGNTFYEQGFCTIVGSTNLNRGDKATTAPTGLPHPGATITSGGYTFQMPPTYAGNDCVFIGNYPAGAVANGAWSSPDYTTGSFTITSPKPCRGFSVLNSAGNGPCVISYTISYSDGNTDSGQFSSINWFTADPSSVFNAAGRVAVDGPTLNNVNGSPAGLLFHSEIAVSYPSSTATNISFNWSSGGRAALFAVSASTDGTTYQPIAVSGYDADIIVEKEQPVYNGGTFTATTATMDLGTNNGNYTWFEKGWITNGIGAGSGLPPAGSTIASLQAANRLYQMPASYSANNAVLIDTNHQVANITPVTPATYSAFSLLTVGASIGSGNTMTNLCILQHADGINETNMFYGKDWMDSTVAAAFIANGRADTRGGLGTSFSGPGATQNPRLFETFFQVNDNASPVTNILVRYQTAGGANWTTYVLAVSATAGAVQPFLGQTILSPANRVFEGSNVVMTATLGGTAPISVQWQFSPNGTSWNNLADGGTISGATTTNLNISSAGWTNSGQYRLTASNAAGSVTNYPLSLTVYSTLPDVTVPSDFIFAYQPNGGSSPAGAEVVHATDNLVGTNSTYINNGVDGGVSPFYGPVGFTITPQSGKTIVSAVRLYTTESLPANDPANWTLEGSNDGGNTWSLITTNAFILPAGRNAIVATALNPLAQSALEIHFPNATGYSSYRVAFWNTANDNAATDIRIGEIELLGTSASTLPVIARQPADATVWAGGSPTFTIQAFSQPLPLTYQWYRGASQIPGATGTSYTLAGAQLADNGATFSCSVTDSRGSTLSRSASLQVVEVTPTGSYPSAIMADHPLAFFRLDEPNNGSGNNGVVAHDYFGGFTGTYSNTVLASTGYHSTLDSDTAAQFGSYSSPDSFVGDISGVDFAKPAGDATAAFSVEAWVLNDPNQLQSSDAGLITKGYGGGGEQFNLDCGNNPTANAHLFRFMVRDSAGVAHRALASVGTTSTKGPFPTPDAPNYSWHHVVGVCDFPHSNVLIYVDGALSGTNDTPGLTNGIMASRWPVSIGSRQSGMYSDYNNQFLGTMDEVAIYNYALTPGQVTAHYYAAQPPPLFSLQPTNSLASENGPLTLYSAAYGPGPLTYNWYQSSDSFTWTLVSGQTGSNLTFTSTPASAGPYFQAVATNPYGSATSAVAQVTIYQGGPQFTVDLPTTNYGPIAGVSLFQVTAYGTAPLTYQWSVSSDGVNFSPLSDGGRVTGSHTDTLRITDTQPANSAFYRVHVSNSTSGIDSTASFLVVLGRPSFNNNGQGWTLNGDVSPPVISNNSLPLTFGNGNSRRSAFFNLPLYIGRFYASWTYQDVGGAGADGYSFCVQNDPRGPSALGGGGGSLGVVGITPSAELEFNIYSNNKTVGLAFASNGVIGAMSTTSPVNVAGGNPINTALTYDGAVARVTLTDTVTGGTFTTNIAIGNLTAQFGKDTAYVGFTGADGGTPSTQNVKNFVFYPITSVNAQLTATNTLVLSWPAKIGAVLQSAANFNSPVNWQNVTAPVTVINGQNQVVVPAQATNAFYRLLVP